MKSIYFISAMMLLFCVKGLAQSNPRMKNENYMYTVFLDNFDTPSLDRTQWNVSNYGKNNCGIWVDGSSTVNQANGSLNLSIISSPGYIQIIPWDHDTLTANYISGEVTSDSAFHYGSFECRAKELGQFNLYVSGLIV
jgi:beta-glucanase (GH16 family)